MAEPDPHTVATLSRLNHVEFLREMARWSGSSGRVEERDGVLLYATGTSFPVTCNGVVRLDEAVPDRQVLDVAEAWFGDLGRGFTLSVRVGEQESDASLEQLALEDGLLAVGDAPVMVCRTPPAAADLSSGVELRWVDEGAPMRDAIVLSDAAYQSLGMPPGVILEACTDVERMCAPHLFTAIAYAGDEPLASAMVLLSHGIAGVYYVGTVEAARGRGLAGAVTRAVTRRAFEHGARFVCLQATTMGEPVYLRMGYVEIERYHGLVRFV